MTHHMRAITICLLLSLSQAMPAQAESAAISENLPLNVQADLLMTELLRYRKVDDNQGIVEIIPRIRALDIEIPDALYFLEASALYRTGKALEARDRLLVYLKNTGTNGKYYEPARELLLAVTPEAEIQEKERRERERQRQLELAKSAEKARALRIREAQRYLQQIGFRQAIENGNFDKPTREALAVYQIRRDLTVNGDITDETLARLKTEVPESDNCDALASYGRSNTDAPIPIGMIAHQAAVPACNEALRRYPEVVRFQIQYARALLAADRANDALTAVKKASKLGYPAADVLIGQMHEMGKFDERNRADYDEALRWYKRAAEQDYPPALRIIGSYIESGYAGFRRSTADALPWYQKAADLGFPPALVDLGDKYASGLGVRRDYNTAMSYYSTAAEAGYAEAQFKLGEMYERGRGVKRNKDTAITWYRRAGNNGHLAASQKLDRLDGRR